MYIVALTVFNKKAITYKSLVFSLTNCSVNTIHYIHYAFLVMNLDTPLAYFMNQCN